MKKWFGSLNPTEQRFVVVVGVIFFIVLNLVLVRPHFGDWGRLQRTLKAAHDRQATYEETREKAERIKAELREFEGGSAVPLADQAIEFLRTIQTQAASAGVQVAGSSKPMTVTNKFFIEQMQTIKVVAEEKQLIDFLYNLGERNSLVRVRGMTVRPDQPRFRLGADVTLVASYQRTLPAAPAQAAKPGSAPATDKRAADKRAADKRPDDRRAADRAAADKRAADKAAADKAGPAAPAKPAPTPARPAPIPARPVPAPAREATPAPAADAPAATKPPALPAPPIARSVTNRPKMPSFKLPTIRTSPPPAGPTPVPPP